MIRFVPFVALLSAVYVLAGCASIQRTESPQLVAAPDKVSMMLAQAADRASIALETLAAVEQARSPEVTVAPIEDVPPALRRAITVNWVGPIEPITKKLADRAGYAFQVIGNGPPVPLVVSVDVENEPVIDVMRSIGLQAGARAYIRVDGQTRTVEIHYAPNTGIGG